MILLKRLFSIKDISTGQTTSDTTHGEANVHKIALRREQLAGVVYVVSQ